MVEPPAPLARLADRIERHALTAAAAATALVLLVVFYYPVGTVFVEAVVVDGRLTLAPFREVLTSRFYVVRLFGFTAYQAALSTVASVALGLPGAWVLARFEFRGRETLRSLTLLPFVLPAIMVAIGFVATFGEGGTLNRLLSVVGLRANFLYALPAIVIAHAFYNAPLVTRVTTAAWEGVDARAVETARSLGASRRRAFLDVIAPQLLPAVLTGATLTFVFTFASFPIVLALGGYELATVEVWIYRLVRDLEYTAAATLAILETLLSLALTYAYLRFERRRAAFGRRARARARRPLVPDSWTPRELLARAAVAGYGLVALLVFVGPILSMIVASVTAPDGGFTLRHYAFLLERQRAGASYQVKPLPAVRNSLLFGLGTLCLAVPMGVAVAVVTGNRRGGKLAEALALAPLAVSGVVVGLGLLRGLVFGVTAFGYRFTVTGALAIVAAHSVVAYPFVVRNVAPLLGSLDRALVESARSLGASRARALGDVELPLVWSGVVAGAALAFAISVGEFDSTVILASGSTSYTMPVAIERYLGRRLGPATAMGCLLLVVTGLSFVVIERFGGRVRG